MSCDQQINVTQSICKNMQEINKSWPFYGITTLGCKLSYGTNQLNKIHNNNND